MEALTDAWRYPVKGIYYASSQPDIWRLVGKFLLETSLFSAVSLGTTFYFGYQPQARYLSRFLGNKLVCTLAASSFVILESFVPTYIFFRKRSHHLEAKVFDRTFQTRRGPEVHAVSARERDALVFKLNNAQEKLAKEGKPQRSIGSVMNYLFAVNPKESKLQSLTRWVVTAPLNALFPFGLVAYVYINSAQLASSYHTKYFDRKGLSTAEEQKAVVDNKRWEYISFGLTATLLNMIPVLNAALNLTNSVGAALWAADLEAKGGALFTAKELAAIEKQKREVTQ